jgi:hypothetical protein
VIANSPSRLSEQRRSHEREEVEQLREREPHASSVTDSERQLAQALLRRAERALEHEHVGADDYARIQTCMANVVNAAERRSPELSQAMDQLSDALLDLV